MSGKHDKSVDEDQSANLLMTGPIVIRGLGRSVKDAFRPGRPSRHRAFVGEDADAAPLAIEAGAPSEPAEQITYEVDALFPSEGEVPQTGENAGPQEDRVDDRADDAPPADTDVEQPWDGSGERSAEDAAPERPAEGSADQPEPDVSVGEQEPEGAAEPVVEMGTGVESEDVDVDSEPDPAIEPDDDQASVEDGPTDGAGDSEHQEEPVVEEPVVEFGDGESASSDDDRTDELAPEDSAVEPDTEDRSFDDAAGDGADEPEQQEETAAEAPVVDFGNSDWAPQEPFDEAEPESVVEQPADGTQPATEEVDDTSQEPSGTTAAEADDRTSDDDAQADGIDVANALEDAAAEEPVVDFGDGGSAPQEPVEGVEPESVLEQPADGAQPMTEEADDSSEDPSGTTSGEVVAVEEQAPEDSSIESDEEDRTSDEDAVRGGSDAMDSLEAASAESPVVERADDEAAPQEPVDGDEPDETAESPVDDREDGSPAEGEDAGALEEQPVHDVEAGRSDPSTEDAPSPNGSDDEQNDTGQPEDEQEVGPTEELATPDSDAAPAQDATEQGIDVADAEARIETIAAADSGVAEDSVDDWFIPVPDDAGETAPESDDDAQTDETDVDAAPAVDEAESVPADVPDGAESDSFDALDGESTGEVPAADDAEQEPDGSAFDEGEPADLEHSGGEEEPAPLADEHEAAPQDDAERDEASSVEDLGEAQPDDEHAEHEVDGGEEPVAEPEDELDDTAFGDDPADADVAEDGQQPETKAEESPRDDSVLAEYLGQRDWTTAEELYSRPITLPTQPDEAVSEEVDAHPSDAQAADDEVEPAADEAPAVENEPAENDAASEAPVASQDAPAEATPADEPAAVPVATAAAAAPKAASRPPRGPRQPRTRPVRERFGREAIGIAVLVVLALVCGGLITAVVLKTQNDARIAAAEAANYTPPPLATPTPAATGPVVAVIGDGSTSIAASGIANADKWSALVGTDLSGTVTTDASNGMGYAAKGASGETFVQAAGKVPSNADVVVIFGGASDANIAPLSLAKAATDAMSAAKQQAPDAKILVVGPAISAGVSDADLTAIRNTLKSAAGIVKATWIDPIDKSWLSSSTQAASSPSSLTAADEKTIASKMEAAIKSALG